MEPPLNKPGKTGANTEFSGCNERQAEPGDWTPEAGNSLLFQWLRISRPPGAHVCQCIVAGRMRFPQGGA